MAQQFTTRSDPTDLLTIAYEDIPVARIDRHGDFHCYDKPKMIVALRGMAAKQRDMMLGALEIEELMKKHKGGGEPPMKGGNGEKEREP